MRCRFLSSFGVVDDDVDDDDVVVIVLLHYFDDGDARNHGHQTNVQASCLRVSGVAAASRLARTTMIHATFRLRFV